MIGELLCKLGIHRPTKKIGFYFTDIVSGLPVNKYKCVCGKCWMASPGKLWRTEVKGESCECDEFSYGAPNGKCLGIGWYRCIECESFCKGYLVRQPEGEPCCGDRFIQITDEHKGVTNYKCPSWDFCHDSGER